MTNPNWAGVDIDPEKFKNYGWYVGTEVVDAVTYNRLIGYMVAALSEMGRRIGGIGASGFGIAYTFSTTTTDADPGAGTIRLNNGTQTSATQLFADLADVYGSDVTALLDTADDSTSTVKGYLRLQVITDQSVWMICTVSALTSASGYRKIAITPVVASSASPFSDGDSLVLSFARTGDKGETGDAGTPASETVAGVAEIATQTETNTGTDDNRYITPLKLETRLTGAAVRQGKHTLVVLGSGLTPRTANGCTAATYEVTTASYDDKGTEAEFDYAVAQAGYVSVPLPKSYNGGSLTYDARGRLTTATSGQTASLRVYARIVNAGTDPSTVAWGTPQAVTLTATATAGALLASAASSALTATGTFSDGAELRLKIERDVATGTATTSKLRLRGLRILIGINAATDD